MSKLDVKSIIKQYEGGVSTKSLADANGVNPTTINRLLRKNGVKIRTISQGQKQYYSENDSHRKGVKLSDAEKEAISLGMQDYYQSLSKDQMKQLKLIMSKNGKKRWNSLSETEKRESIEEMHRANRLTADGGSKLENAIASLLEENGYKVVQRTKSFVPKNEFEIDIFVPGLDTAIEVDGKTHFEPIFGDEALAKTQSNDTYKNDTLLAAGFTVIRLRNNTTAFSQLKARQALKLLLDLFKKPLDKRVYLLNIE